MKKYWLTLDIFFFSIVLCAALFVAWQMFNNVQPNIKIFFGAAMPALLYNFIKAIITNEACIGGIPNSVTRKEDTSMYWFIVSFIAIFFLFCFVYVVFA